MTKIRGRFEVLNENGWLLIDNKWNRTLSFENMTRARAAAAFARLYVRLWGDINFCSRRKAAFLLSRVWPLDSLTPRRYVEPEVFR